MTGPERAAAGRDPVVLTGIAATAAPGRGLDALADAAGRGRAGFAPVDRFDTGRWRARSAACLPGAPVLVDELVDAVRQAVAQSGLTAAERAACPLLLAAVPPGSSTGPGAARTLATVVARRGGLGPALRLYTTACVASSTAVIDAAVAVTEGRYDRVVVAAGYLVDQDRFALFDAGRAMTPDAAMRPFSADRQGLLLGDGIAAVVVESAAAARRRGVPVLARLVGWARTGDAHHVSQPHPEGRGLARAVTGALDRAGLTPEHIGYVNAHGTGTAHSDAAEAAALRTALGAAAGRVPVSSTKSVHGHTLEASALVELALTVRTLHTGRLPVNAGHRLADEECPLRLVLRPTVRTGPGYALSLNTAFGGANTALLVGAP
jgi:3-oxoacyl-(acyl-carrier-protein) synthase